MNLTNVSIYAEGHYSESTHAEDVFIKTESYNRFKEQIDGIEIYIGGLDGKHSECEVDLLVSGLQ